MTNESEACKHSKLENVEFKFDGDELHVHNRCGDCGAKLVEWYSRRETIVYGTDGQEIERW